MLHDRFILSTPTQISGCVPPLADPHQSVFYYIVSCREMIFKVETQKTVILQTKYHLSGRLIFISAAMISACVSSLSLTPYWYRCCMLTI